MAALQKSPRLELNVLSVLRSEVSAPLTFPAVRQGDCNVPKPIPLIQPPQVGYLADRAIELKQFGGSVSTLFSLLFDGKGQLPGPPSGFRTCGPGS